MVIVKFLITLKMKRGNQITILLTLVISLFFYSCNSSSVKVVKLRDVKSKRLEVVYKYYETNFDNIYFVNRYYASQKDTTFPEKYFLSVKNDTTFIGLQFSDSLFFLPYLFRNSNDSAVFDFNKFSLKDEVILNSSGSLKKIQEQQGQVIYEGFDYYNIYNENITIGFEGDYIAKSIKTKSFEFEIDTLFTEKSSKVKIRNLKYFK